MDRCLKWNNELPWSERINAISINPGMATIDDIAKLAAEHGQQHADNEAYQKQIADLCLEMVDDKAENKTLCDRIEAQDEELAAIKASFRKYKNDAQAENKLLRDAKKELDFTKDTLAQWLGENKGGWSADDVLEIIKHTHFDEIELRKAITAKALKDNND